MSLLSCFAALVAATLLVLLIVGGSAYALGHRTKPLPPAEPPLVFHVTPETWRDPNPEIVKAIASDKPVTIYFEAGLYDAHWLSVAKNTTFTGAPQTYGTY